MSAGNEAISAEVFASFTRQDSGCDSYGVTVEGCRLFVKAAAEDCAIASLERAVRLHREVSHASIIPLLHTITLPTGLALVYPWVEGEVLYGAPTTGRPARLDPGGAHARFRARPLAEVLLAFDSIIDAHLAVADAGFVAVDLYDGCFIYDFDAPRMWICDLDEYRPGPFVLTDERLPGSGRFMAPEEFLRGSVIDQRTTVFNLGRAAAVLLNEGDLDGHHRGPAATANVIERATHQQPEDRYLTVADFAAAWRAAAAQR